GGTETTRCGCRGTALIAGREATRDSQGLPGSAASAVFVEARRRGKRASWPQLRHERYPKRRRKRFLPRPKSGEGPLLLTENCSPRERDGRITRFPANLQRKRWRAGQVRGC